MKLGIVTFPSSGHLNAMLGLARELKNRGHEVVFFHFVDAAEQITQHGYKFVAIGEVDYPRGSLLDELARLSKLTGRSAFRLVMLQIKRHMQVFFRELPAALKQNRIDALIVDQIVPYAGTVADYLSLPYVAISNAIPLNQDPSIPPFFVGWPYRSGLMAQFRNRLGFSLLKIVSRPVLREVKKQRALWRLPPQLSDGRTSSRLADITQLPEALDFPRANVPDTFHYTGPFGFKRIENVHAFPWGALNGKPLVYASMGTVQNGDPDVFHKIAQACAELDVQLVLSIGVHLDERAFDCLPGNPIIVKIAPQLAVLKRTSVMITHGGVNTVLEALANGIPMVLVPISSDQPGMAARVAWRGAGIVLDHRKLSATSVRSAMQNLIENHSFRAEARRLQEELEGLDGPGLAANIIEEVLSPLVSR